MHPRATPHHVAVLNGKFVRSHCPEVFLECSSTLVTMVGISLTPRDNRLIMSSSSFNKDCNRFPDVCALGLSDSLRPDDDDAFCYSLLGIQ